MMRLCQDLGESTKMTLNNILVSHPVSESKDSLDFVPALKFIVKLGKRE